MPDQCCVNQGTFGYRIPGQSYQGSVVGALWGLEVVNGKKERWVF